MRAVVVAVVGLMLSGLVQAQADASHGVGLMLLRNGLLWGAAPLVALAAMGFVLALRWRKARAGGAHLGFWPLAMALLVGTGILAMSAYTTYYTAAKLRHVAAARYQVEFDRVEEGLQRQFEAMIPTLRGIRASTAIGVHFGREELQHWITARDLDQEFPGVLGLGLVSVQPNQVRATEVQVLSGLLLEPRELQGMATDLPWDGAGKLFEAVQSAVRSGRPALSGAVPLQRQGATLQTLVVVLPLYQSTAVPSTQEQRIAQVRSVALGFLHLNDFLAGLDAASHGLVAFELRDGLEADTAQVVFRSDRLTDSSFVPLFDSVRNVLLGQRFLQLRVVTTPEFEQGIDAHLVGYIAAAGSTLAVLFGFVVWMLMVGRARAMARARMLVRDVERLALVAERTSNAVVITDAQECITWVNEGFTRITGYQLAEALGKRPKELLQSSGTSLEIRAQLRQALDKGESCRARLLNVGKNGGEYWVDVEIQPQRDPSGKLIGFMAIEQDVTEQVAAAQALARERERADGILLGSNVGTWQVNLQTGETLVNEQWSRMMGFEPAEVDADVQAFWESRVRPEDLVRVGNLLEACRNGSSLRYETDVRVRHKNGQWIWLMSRAVLMSHDAQGRPEWLAGIHMDVTAERKTEEGLRDMQAFLYRSGRAAHVGAWEMDINTGVIKWSEQTCEIHGVDHGHLPTQEEALSYYDKDGRRQLTQAMEQAPQTLMGWDLTLPFTDVEGNAKWVRNVGEVEFDDSGPVRLVGAFQDVTAIRSAEMEMHKTSSVLQSVLDSAVQVGILATNLERVITVFNKGAERMLGYSADELVHRETASRFFALEQMAVIQETLTLDLGHAPDAAEVFAYVISHPELSEWTFVRKDQSRLTVQLLISPMYDHAGQAVGYLGVIQDITEQKQQELMLREAKAQAEAASVAKSQFLANMSHEIRTPMNAILGMLRLLQNTPLSLQQKDYIHKTLGAAKSLLGLLNDILDFSKVEAGKLQLDPHPFLLDDLLTDMSVILSSNLGAKPVDLIFDIDPALPQRMLGDALRIKQVLINLGGNALKFTAQGHVALVWTCVGRTGNRLRSRIEVRDTGIGIAAENQAKIFDGFSQAEASTTRKYGGTGLGLAISQRLIRLLGSELTLQSNLGEGSTFAFDLDLPVLPDEPSEWQGTRMVSAQVLVVDDNRDSREAIARAARANGWQVETADSAAQALQRLHQSNAARLDAVFFDERMPGEDGWQLFARLLSAAPTLPLPLPRCILMSSKGSEMMEAQHAGLYAQLDGYIVKPFTAGMLMRAWAQAQRKEPGGVAPVAESAPARLGGMRVLVVEDNPINQQVARELLTAEGATVTLADNGQLGVEALRQAPQGFDVVLMDMQMPVMDGLTAARMVRQQLGLQSLPIIAMTANAMVSDREACLDAGMNDHVGKPFDLNHLVATLCQYTGWVATGATPKPAVEVHRPVTADAHPWDGHVDIAQALERMGGFQDLYRDTLSAYLPEAQGLHELVRSALAAGDREAARRSLHSFKGLSATVGVGELQALAAELEARLKTDSSDITVTEDDLAGLSSTIARLLQPLQALVVSLGGGVKLVEDVPVMASPEILERLQRLLAHLHAQDMNALSDYAEFQRDAPEALRPLLEPLQDALASLDFAAAEAECQMLVDRLKRKQ